MTASMFIDAKLNQKWWYHAVQHTCSIINMGKQYQGRSGEDMIWTDRTSYGQLYPFGTEWWAGVPTGARYKSDLTQSIAIKGELLHTNMKEAGYLILTQ
jgi:hypothetical protein